MKTSISKLIIAITALFFLTSCTKNNNASGRSVNTYVLVHGAWQGAWVWQNVKTGLENNGQKVIVVELPAHGDDNTLPVATSINAYRDKVIAAINTTTSNVILVGHSMGGVVITAVAEKIPARIKKLVYIGAFLPANGQSLLQLALTDSTSLLGPSLIPSQDQLTLDVKHENITNIFCQDGNDVVKAQVLAKYRVEPAIPFADPIAITDANFGTVNKYYVHTLLDNAVGLKLQKRMVAAAKITHTFNLNSGHCPFLTMPDQTIRLLLAIGDN